MNTPRKLNWTELKYFSNLTSTKTQSIDLIGQARAKEALEFGLLMDEKGYNVYVAGQSGTGRTTFATSFAKEIAEKKPTPPDICYVYNFENPKQPKLLRIPAGIGKELKSEMTDLITKLTVEIPRAFHNREHEQRKNSIVKVLKTKHEEIIRLVTEEAKKADFEVKNSSSGIFFVPIINGEAIGEEQFDDLSLDEREAISKKSESIQQHASDALREIKDWEKSTKKEVEDLDYSLGLLTVGHYMSDIFQKFAKLPEVLSYLNAVKEDILDNLPDFLSQDSDEEEGLPGLLPGLGKKNNEDIMSKYKVNLLTDNSGLTGAPVVVDFNPSYTNLVGDIEFDNEFGNFSTDFMKIKPGLLHKANGGYLILQAQDLLSQHHAWEVLRRSLITGQIVTEPLREYNTGIAVNGIKPETIPLDVKVIIIGGWFYYHILHYYDDYFEKLFKIRADFDYEMKLGVDSIDGLVSFAKKHSKLPPDASALNQLVEYSTRMAGKQDKLSANFGQFKEIIDESAARAKMAGAKKVSAKHVIEAINKREFRLNLYEEKLSELIEEDVVMISTDGDKVGQINGLAVIDTGDFAFAKPSRITATTYMGTAGIVNIEKEADMSGEIHDKGVQVLTGYLGQKYAQNFPLNLSARICFEQNYSGIDGDSASSTELYAILSSLSGVPIRQDIAVTGSINQHGEIQPIGGVTHKVEGFFDICKKRGLTGKQGVLIPTRNIKDLVLKDEVIEAIKKEQFHIYPISYIDEGIEILMQMSAGTEPYSAETVHGKAYRKLRSYHKKGEQK